MSTPQEKRSPPFQMRLTDDFRLQLEKEMRKDGDSALATWIKKNFYVKNYNHAGLTLKVNQLNITNYQLRLRE